MPLTAKQVFPMAYDRTTFKNLVMEKIDGALVEYYKAALAELNGQTKWVQHWRGEVERLLFIELHTVFARPIKGRWDRRRATAEVVAELQAADAGYRRVAEGAIKRYYGLKKITKRLDDDVTRRFYGMVEEAVAEGRGLAEVDQE